MAELFTEEDVRRYARVGMEAIERADRGSDWHSACINDDGSTECKSARGGLDMFEPTLRAILSALAEDGRLRSPDEIVMSAEELDALPDDSPELAALRERVAKRRQSRLWQAVGWTGQPAYAGMLRFDRVEIAGQDVTEYVIEPAESGGALPSDTPALADAYAAAAVALAGYATEPYGDLRLNAERASAKAVTAALSVLGLVNHSADPVSVLEEETRDDPRTS